MIDYHFIGWCSDPIKNHDKVWTAIIIKNDYGDMKVATIWGRRGKALQSKVIETTVWDLNSLIRQKENKGYKEYSKDKLDQVYPEFETDLEMSSTWALLKG